jgi:hypothetical protein
VPGERPRTALGAQQLRTDQIETQHVETQHIGTQLGRTQHVMAQLSGSEPGTALVLLAWCLLALGDSAREGEFSVYGLIFLVIGLGLVVTVIIRRMPLVVPDRRLLALPLTVCAVAAIAHPARRLMHSTHAGVLTIEILSAVAAGLAALSLLVPDRYQRRAWFSLLALAAATGIVTVIVASDPRIDVWFLLQQSSQGLLHGDDMYRQNWVHSTGLQNVYPYLPGTTLILAPFRWLLGDVRYGLLLAILLGAFVVRRLSPLAPAALAGMLLVMPHWAFLVDQSWTEPLLVTSLAAAILALQHDRPFAAMLALAVALACKQHIILLLPLFAMWPAFGWRRTIGSAVLAGLVVLPWLIAGPRDLWHDAVHANLALGVERRALCLPSVFDRWGFVVGFWFLLLALAAAYTVVLRWLPRTPSALALGCAVVMWTLDLANKQSFFNHYTLPLGLLVVAVAAAERASNRTGSRTGAPA